MMALLVLGSTVEVRCSDNKKNIKKVHHKIQYIENRFLHTTDHKKIVHFKAAAKKKEVESGCFWVVRGNCM